jgi:hypothetical protein
MFRKDNHIWYTTKQHEAVWHSDSLIWRLAMGVVKWQLKKRVCVLDFLPPLAASLKGRGEHSRAKYPQLIR